MLFTEAALNGILDGSITLAFRRWRVLRVREGSTFRTSHGVITVSSVEEIDLEDISSADARHAGFGTLHSLLDELAGHAQGRLYRIGVRFAGADPRIALRGQARISEVELGQLREKLMALGRKSADGAWAIKTLQLIAAHPATRAAKLAQMVDMDTLAFKRRVRQLKELGLTESLDIGYQLSPRGRALLSAIDVP